MSVFKVLIILLFCFIVLTLAIFALTSCLGDEIRSAWSGRRTRSMPTYGLQYAQAMGQGGHGGYSEHIEMEDMLGRWEPDEDDH